MAEAYKGIINNLRKGIVDQCELNSLENGIEQYRKQNSEMQSYIDYLKAELEEVKQNKVYLPTESIKVADMLIDKFTNASGDYVRATIKNGYTLDYVAFCDMRQKEIKLLRQIAEHLLVYCNNSEE